MAKTRRKLDTFQQAAAVERRLKEESPGWRRERLMAVQLGIVGELSLQEIASAVGHSRSTIQDWFDLFREGGMERLLEDQRVNNHGPKGFLCAEAKEHFEGEVAKGRFRTAPQMQRWVEKELGIKAAVTPKPAAMLQKLNCIQKESLLGKAAPSHSSDTDHEAIGKSLSGGCNRWPRIFSPCRIMCRYGYPPQGKRVSNKTNAATATSA